MLGIPWALHLDGHAIDGPFLLCGGGRQALANRRGDPVTQQRGHARESGTVSVGTPMSPAGS